MLYYYTDIGAIEWQAATEPLIHHDAQCVLIAGGAGFSAQLLWGHIDCGAGAIGRMDAVIGTAFAHG